MPRSFRSRNLISSYFFKNTVDEAGFYFLKNTEAVIVNDIRYRQMLTVFFQAELNNINLECMWFQQDGPTRHYTNETVKLLKEQFNIRVISRNGGVNWPKASD